MAWKVEFKLPGISIANDDVGSLFRRARPEGPFLIVSRVSGLALDTAFQTHQGAQPHFWSSHAQAHQRWSIHPSGTRGEVLVASEVNGLVLDATRDHHDDPHPVMWEAHREPWQRWRLEPNPDGIGYRIQTVYNSSYLAAGGEAANGSHPWFKQDRNSSEVEWLFLLPYGTKDERTSARSW